MKSLSQFILEADTKANDTEKKEQKHTVTFDFNDIDGGADLLSSVKSICSSDGVHTDTANLNRGIKIECTPDKIETLEKVVEVVQEFISSISGEDHDDIADKLDKMSSSLDKLNDIIDNFVDDIDDTDEE